MTESTSPIRENTIPITETIRIVNESVESAEGAEGEEGAEGVEGVESVEGKTFMLATYIW